MSEFYAKGPDGSLVGRHAPERRGPKVVTFASGEVWRDGKLVKPRRQASEASDPAASLVAEYVDAIEARAAAMQAGKRPTEHLAAIRRRAQQAGKLLQPEQRATEPNRRQRVPVETPAERRRAMEAWSEESQRSYWKTMEGRA